MGNIHAQAKSDAPPHDPFMGAPELDLSANDKPAREERPVSKNPGSFEELPRKVTSTICTFLFVICFFVMQYL